MTATMTARTTPPQKARKTVRTILRRGLYAAAAGACSAAPPAATHAPLMLKKDLLRRKHRRLRRSLRRSQPRRRIPVPTDPVSLPPTPRRSPAASRATASDSDSDTDSGSGSDSGSGTVSTDRTGPARGMGRFGGGAQRNRAAPNEWAPQAEGPGPGARSARPAAIAPLHKARLLTALKGRGPRASHTGP